MTIAYILKIIINKFSYWKKVYPVILLKIDKKLKVGFYYTILHLVLTIYLRLDSGRKLLFDAKKLHNNNQNFEMKKNFQSITIKSKKP